MRKASLGEASANGRAKVSQARARPSALLAARGIGDRPDAGDGRKSPGIPRLLHGLESLIPEDLSIENCQFELISNGSRVRAVVEDDVLHLSKRGR